MIKNFIKKIDAYVAWLLIRIASFFVKSHLDLNKPTAILFLTPAQRFNRFTVNADYAKILANASSSTSIKTLSLEKYLPGFVQVIKILILLRKNRVTIVISSYVPSIYRFPDLKCVAEINTKIAQVKLIWADTHFEGIEKRIIPTIDLVSEHIVSDDPSLRFRQIPRLGDLPVTFFPFPAFPRQWYDSDLQDCDKKFDVFFSGTVSGGSYHNRRNEYLNYAKANGIALHGFTSINFGKLNDVRPNYTKYLAELGNSKIGLNFSWHSDVGAVTGRVWEVIVTGAMLLTTDDDISLQEILKPNEDYVTFSTKEDMLDKIIYYLQNSKQRIKIANSARNKVKFEYAAENFISLINRNS